VLNNVKACGILTKKILRAPEVQENEENPNISRQTDHSAEPMIEPITAQQRLMGQLTCSEPKSALNKIIFSGPLVLGPMKFKKMKKFLTHLEKCITRFHQ
jgi:hypothetical protein